MTKILMAALTVAMVGTAGAQTWQGNYGTYTLVGCYQTNVGVRCDFSYLPSSDTSLY